MKQSIGPADRRSNPNLLDNWYFKRPVNQRGETLYDLGYAGEMYVIDRWKTSNRTTLTLESDGLALKYFKASTGTYGLFTCIENWQDYVGRKITFSALITGVTGVFRLAANTTTDYTQYFNTAKNSAPGLHSLTFTVPADANTLQFAIAGEPGTDANLKIVACKAEFGDCTTLAHQENGAWTLSDPLPSYALELLKCQRYYQLFTSADRRPTEAADFRPVMRINPVPSTIDIGGKTYYTADANL